MSAPATTLARSTDPRWFSARERLRDGRTVEIRAFQPGDRAGLRIAVGERSSDESLRSRFLTVRRHFSTREIDFFMNVDFINQVALVVVADAASGPEIVGAGRYIVAQPGTAEVALAIIDEYQGLGIGAALLRHLIALAQSAGWRNLVAHVLSVNGAMLRVFRKCGVRTEIHHEREVAHITLELNAAADAPPG